METLVCSPSKEIMTETFSLWNGCRHALEVALGQHYQPPLHNPCFNAV